MIVIHELKRPPITQHAITSPFLKIMVKGCKNLDIPQMRAANVSNSTQNCMIWGAENSSSHGCPLWLVFNGTNSANEEWTILLLGWWCSMSGFVGSSRHSVSLQNLCSKAGQWMLLLSPIATGKVLLVALTLSRVGETKREYKWTLFLLFLTWHGPKASCQSVIHKTRVNFFSLRARFLREAIAGLSEIW